MKILLILRAFTLILLLFCGALHAQPGVPDPDSSEVELNPGSGCYAICPQGDFGEIEIEVTVKDSDGAHLANVPVTVYPDPSYPGFCFCTGEVPQTGITDENGYMVANFTRFGGCGQCRWYVEAGGVLLEPSQEVHIVSYDNNGDCQVNLSDFINFAFHYLTSDACFDYDCDGDVDLMDYAGLANHYHHDCPLGSP